MKAIFPLTLLALVASTALGNDAGLLHCRAVADAANRLACYDALVVPASASGPGQGAVASAQAVDASNMPQQAQDQFGLEGRLARKGELQALESHIPGHFEGWRPNTKIELANGQVWQVTDDSRAMFDLQDPKISIRRGMLGAFYLELEGSNRSPKVKRVQ